MRMPDFIVLDTSDKTQRAALLDRFGRYHVAQFAESLPQVGTELIGTYPSAGPRVLVAESSGDVYRVNFEEIDCDRQVTYERLPR